MTKCKNVSVTVSFKYYEQPGNICSLKSIHQGETEKGKYISLGLVILGTDFVCSKFLTLLWVKNISSSQVYIA